MKQICTHIFISLFIATSIQVSGQSLEFIIQQQLNVTANEFNLSPQDISEWTITDQHISPNSGIQHIYIRQQYQGLEIIGANADLHLIAQDKTQDALSFHNQFIPNAALNINQANTTTEPTISAIEAVKAAAEQLGYRLTASISILKTFDENGQNLLLSTGGISLENIPAKLVYQADQSGALKLAWDISILELNNTNWWSLRIDATTGQILDKYNWTLSCNFSTTDACSDLDDSNNVQKHTHKLAPTSKTANTNMVASYNVYAVPVESPIHGGRTVISDPSDALGSPFGWHDINGVAGAEYTITRGNNVHAQEDINGNNGTGYSPDGGAALNFNYPIDLNQAPSNNQNANITNLFYWNNIIHDVAYRLGFTEASGNFQENNYGKGGFGSDYVYADAQDGSGTNNANFSTPPDGSNPRMQMFLWTAPNPDRDGDLDNGIVLHEYGHGISIRLTGGASTSGCLSNAEQMGEGWSDYWGVMLTMKDTDQGTDRRGVGTYALNQSTTGDGIREFPYSTNMSINSHTYDRIKTASIPHGIGSVWCAMLWEMSWELINANGFDDDFYQGTGGNNIAMQLVMEGLKLQPCSPGFVDGRDAILMADTALYGGANSCLIWKAFAKRGLGYSASQGSSSSRTDGTQAFDLPPGLNSNCTTSADYAITISPSSQAACPGQNFVYNVTVLAFNGYNGTVNLSATTLPNGVNSNLSTSTFNTFPGTATWTISNTAGLAAGAYSIALSGTDGSIPHQKTATLEISPTAPAPTLTSPANNATVASLTQTLTWSAVNEASNYDLQMATDAAFTNLIINQVVTNTSYPTGVLSPGTTYYWRVRSNSCTTSTYNTFNFTTASACGQQFTDSGGPNGNHTNNELIQWIFCPDNAGEAIRVTFTSFNLETRGTSDCYDDLTVYNGNSTSAPSLGAFCGTMVTDAPGGGVITATNASGCLTFVFDSDGSVTRPGWIANITCLGCAEPIVSDIDLDPENCTGSNDGRISVTANAINPVEYILTPDSGSPLTNTTGVFSNLAAGNYSIVLRTIADTDCTSDPTAITLPVSNPTISNISTIDGSCANINDGRITITSAATISLDYVLTPVGGNPITNTTGIFSNLAAGDYTAFIRKTGNATCVSTTSNITLNTKSTLPPTIEHFEICLREALGATDGLKANCGDAICNAVTIQPNTIINATSPSICETITVNEAMGTVSEIYLSMRVQHQYIGDISATLESPDGTTITLFDRPGRPDNSTFGCSQDNLNIVFADTASLTAVDLEDTCNPSSGTGAYAIEGAFQSVNLFASLNGETANGDWKICITDSYVSADHGVLEAVTLIVNPAKSTTTWWDAETGGNLLFTGDTFDPVKNGSVDPEQAGTYSFWAQCECSGCPSQRILSNFVVSGRFYFEDNDQDGYGDASNEIVICEDASPPSTTHVTNFTDCNDNNSEDVMMVINNQPIASGMHQANAIISSEGTIFSGSNLVTFQAGQEIRLLPGFHAQAGSSFLAKIDSCGQHPSEAFQNTPLNPAAKQATTIIKHPIAAALKVFPNPFNTQTTLAFDLKQSGKITLAVYDNFGRLIQSFYQNQWEEAGNYQVTFERANLSSGLFLAVLTTEHSVVTQRIVLTQ